MSNPTKSFNKARMATSTSPSVFDAPPSFNLKPAINAGPR